MKNIKIFSSVTEYENAKSEGLLITPNISFINESGGIICLPKLEDPYNGYEYVDLGLPSGLNWATCNIGASSPEQTGLYFAWGETTGYTADNVISKVHSFDDANYTTSDISTNLTLENDAAHVNMGGNWRMPTKDEYQELLDNCNITWMNNYTNTGIDAYMFTSKINGKFILFPNTGYCSGNVVNHNLASNLNYWSTSWYSPDMAFIMNLSFGSLEYTMRTDPRCLGHSVRAVCE